MKSWRTTLAGTVAAIGVSLTHNPDPTIATIGRIMEAVGLFLAGLVARDNKVSSEAAGAK